MVGLARGFQNCCVAAIGGVCQRAVDETRGDDTPPDAVVVARSSSGTDPEGSPACRGAIRVRLDRGGKA